jgi:cytochrome c-type biogenesis protein CcmH
MLALLLAAIVFIVLALILVPLLRARVAEQEAGSFDQAVYRDQLRELDRDLARGVLDESEAAAARLEIQRRLLTAAAIPSRSVRGGASPIAAAVVALLVVGGSVGLYVRIGAPSVPDMPFASRRIDTDSAKLAQALSRLKRRAEAEPSNPEAWSNYGRAAADASQWGVAADALKRAIDLGQNDPELLSAYGEMLTLMARGTVVPAARTAFAAALAKDPTLEAARYYTALAAGQDGDPAKELSLLQTLLADLPGDSPGRADIANRIGEAAKAAGVPVPPLPSGKPAEAGPDAATMAAASQLPPEQREAMVRGMVARLAEKMAANPNDVDGWLRLGRAYGVLGDSAKATEAYQNAAALKPADAEILQMVAQAMLSNLPATAPVPPAAVKVLQEIETLTPGQPAVLWYLGLAAAQSGKPNDARGYWGRLLAGLPPDGEEAKTIKSAMEALRNK